MSIEHWEYLIDQLEGSSVYVRQVQRKHQCIRWSGDIRIIPYFGSGLRSRITPSAGTVVQKVSSGAFAACSELSCSSQTHRRDSEHRINRAIYRIFGVRDSSSLEYLKVCVNLNSMAHLIDRKRCKFIDSLMSAVRFSNLLLVSVQNSVWYVIVYTGLLLPFYSVLFIFFYFSRVLHLIAK